MIIKMIVVIWLLAIAKNELCPMNLCFVYSKCPRKREKKERKKIKQTKIHQSNLINWCVRVRNKMKRKLHRFRFIETLNLCQRSCAAKIVCLTSLSLPDAECFESHNTNKWKMLLSIKWNGNSKVFRHLFFFSLLLSNNVETHFHSAAHWIFEIPLS